jgi:hypothetical protein
VSVHGGIAHWSLTTESWKSFIPTSGPLVIWTQDIGWYSITRLFFWPNAMHTQTLILQCIAWHGHTGTNWLARTSTCATHIYTTTQCFQDVDKVRCAHVFICASFYMCTFTSTLILCDS